MKLNNIIKVAALAALVVVGASSCQSKKKKAAAEAAAKAAAEEAARQKAAEEEAARLAALTFEVTEDVALSASETVADGVEAYRQALAEAKKATAYGATSFAVPSAGILYANEMCDLVNTKDGKETLEEFLAVWKASDKKSVILIEAYSNDGTKAAPEGVSKADYNAAIAVERARLVKEWLLAQQVPAKNVKVACACKTRKIDGDKKRVNVSIK